MLDTTDILDNIPLAMVAWDLNFLVNGWNAAAEKLFGYSKAQAIGNSVLSLVVPSASRVEVKRLMEALHNGQGGYFNINDNLTASGRKIVCQWSSSKPVYNGDRCVGGYAFATNVTDRLAKEQNLLSYKIQWQSVLRHLNDYVTVTDLTTKIQVVNKTITNLAVSDVVGKFMYDFVPSSNLPNVKRVVANTIAFRCAGSYETWFDWQGQRRWWEVQVLPVVDDLKTKQLIFLANDVTKQREAYDEVERLVENRTKSLRRANRQLLKAIKRRKEVERQLKQHQQEWAHYSRLSMVTEMASGIAHEINQPLAMIVNYTTGCVERLREQPVPKEIITMMTRATEQAERAGDIIHHLRHFLSRGEQKRQATDLRLAIEGAVSLLRFERREASIAMQLQLSESPAMVLADKIQLEQVLINLIHNAQDAIKESGAPQAVITIKMIEERDKWLMIIHNTGSVISESELAKVFEPFFTTKHQGMGIGLSICKTIIENHDGKIEVKSSARAGTEFSVSLPKLTEEQ